MNRIKIAARSGLPGWFLALVCAAVVGAMVGNIVESWIVGR